MAEKETVIPDEMRKRIHEMAKKTWNAIAHDILTEMEHQGEDPNLPRDHVAEIVGDAGNMQQYGGDPDAYSFWNKLDYTPKLQVLAECFHETEGW